MPDAPDDFDYSQVGEFTANLDSSELAARLYSPAGYARTAQMLYATDFSKGISGLDPDVTVGLGTIVLSTDHSSLSGLALKLTNSSNDDVDCFVGTTIPFVLARYYTLDIGFYLNGEEGETRLELYVFYEGVSHHLDLYLQQNPFRLIFRDVNNNYVDITSYETSESYFGNFYHLRATIDIETRLMKELTINSVPFEVSSLEYMINEASYVNQIALDIGARTNSAFDVTMYLQWVFAGLSNF